MGTPVIDCVRVRRAFPNQIPEPILSSSFALLIESRGTNQARYALNVVEGSPPLRSERTSPAVVDCGYPC